MIILGQHGTNDVCDLQNNKYDFDTTASSLPFTSLQVPDHLSPLLALSGDILFLHYSFLSSSTIAPHSSLPGGGFFLYSEFDYSSL
jgi:hypothetical protein